MSDSTLDLARRVVDGFVRARLTVATAESLTAGLLVSTLVDVPGASGCVRGGLVTYATDLKETLADVDPALLAAHGPVDPEVAGAMARGARQRCGADVGIACTGVAGPDPQDGKDVGLVYIGLAVPSGTTVHTSVHEYRFPGARRVVREATVDAALELLEAVV